MTSQSSPPSAELYLRSLAPTGMVPDQTQTMEQLETLVAEDRLDSFTVEVTGRGVLHDDCCLSTAVGQALVERLDAVERWARHNDANIPGIATKTVEPSPVHEQRYTVTTVPTALLLEYDGATLRFVSPVTVGDRHVSVSEHLDAISTTADVLPIRASATGLTVPFRETEPDQHEATDRSDSPLMVSLDTEDAD